MAGQNHSQAVVLMRVRFRMFVDVCDAAVIEKISVAFGRGFQPRQEICEFRCMPAADIPQNALALDAVRARCPAIGMSIVVMPRGSVAQPRETRKALAFRQHVRNDTRLPRY